MEGGSGSRAAHRIVMAGAWHLAVTWASRKAFADSYGLTARRASERS